VIEGNGIDPKLANSFDEQASSRRKPQIPIVGSTIINCRKLQRIPIRRFG
jgi:hypothetical protein